MTSHVAAYHAGAGEAGGKPRPPLGRRQLLTRAGAVGLGAAVASTLLHPGVAEAAVITDTFLDEGGAVFNVKAYGAVGNGTTDDRTAIGNALAAAVSSGGGIVYFPQGTYRITSGFTVAIGGISFVGAGRTATNIKVDFGSGDVIRYYSGTAASVATGSVRAMTFTSTSARTGGATIRLTHADEIYIQDVDMYNMYNGVVMDGTGGVLQYVDRGYWRNFAPGGVGVWINIDNSGGNDQYLSNLLIYGGTSTIANQPLAGIRITGTQAVYMNKANVLQTQTGLLIDPPGNNPITWGFFVDCTFDTCGYRGILISPAPSAKVYGLHFVDCWTSTSTTYDGFYIGGSGKVDGIEIIGHRALNNHLTGIYVTGSLTKNVFIDNSVVSGNNGASNGSNGISVTNGVTGFAVRSCRVGAMFDFGPSQHAGIYVDSTCDSYIVTGNITTGNIANGINAASGTTKIVAHNL